MDSKNRFITFSFVVFLLILMFLSYAKAWDNVDHEIFSTIDDLEAFEGKHANFYSWLNLEPSATQEDINKAFRKLSLALHPDKNPDSESKERFALLGRIKNFLRDPELRERYNFFLKNGVPKWRGTGYYYVRYRPGLKTVLVGLLVLGSLLHYMIMWVNYFQEKKRIRYYIKESREIAWGKRMKKQLTRKRVNVNELAFIVGGDYVALLTDNGEFELDEEKISRPKITEMMIFAFPGFLYQSIKKQFSKKESSNTDDNLINSGYEKESFSSDDERSEVGDNLKSRTRKRRGGKRQNK